MITIRPGTEISFIDFIHMIQPTCADGRPLEGYMIRFTRYGDDIQMLVAHTSDLSGVHSSGPTGRDGKSPDIDRLLAPFD